MFKKIILLCLGVFIFISGNTLVKADNITYKKLDGIYFNLKVNDKVESNYVTMFYLDDRLAYCIEPGKDITTSNYDAFTDWSKVNIGSEKSNYLEKIGYYGYEYPGHQTDKYYIATQELIWQAFNNVEIYFTTEKNGNGNIIDISKEKEQILKLVKGHDTYPSFSNTKITGKVGRNLMVEDTNKVLSDYDISTSKNHKIKIKDNTLSIDFNNELVNEEVINLTKKNYDNKTLLVYLKEGSQQLASLRLSSTNKTNFTLANELEEVPEVIKVPVTGIDNSQVKHFNVFCFGVNNGKKFN